MSQVTIPSNGTAPKHNRAKRLPLIGDAELDLELDRFRREEEERLGLATKTVHWVDEMTNAQFSAKERPNITLLVSGLTAAHDHLIVGALTGVGYRVQALDCPDNEALRFGKEFGNRAQCNPTYFTVGNLVKHLCKLRDEDGLAAATIIERFVFVTAGACGPCRFGMYATEYRKALRDAGFDGFRVVLFQQTGGFSQATGDDVGLKLDRHFFTALAKALIAGDVINALGYRIRPYEVEPGATDKAIQTARKACHDALAAKRSILWALLKAKMAFEAVEVDRTRPKPKVSVIGEFWAMTTEGDGNYQLQRFLESEGAEVEVQLVTAWLLYLLWEARRDTRERTHLRGADYSKYGLAKLDTWGLAKRQATLAAAEVATRAIFQTFAHAVGLYGYHLPNMDVIAEVANEHYSNDLRGGEGHMEVGKLIVNVERAKAHMTVSVKPFGCMPSAGVSDGVQSLVSQRNPGTLFCAVETSGDGAVNFYSRVQMYLFKAKQAAVAELEQACREQNVTLDDVRSYVRKNRRIASSLFVPKHHAAGTATNTVVEVASALRATPWTRVARGARRLAEAAKRAPARASSSALGVVSAIQWSARAIREDVAAWSSERAKNGQVPRATA